MTKIESRPIPGLAFEFLFYLDFEGNLFDPAVLDFIGHLKREYADFQLLGNYPEH